ncbi:unnamed protein product [Closterium sp. Naga37s-1]|nr:unnamed protein product [Closterium sp. Naga37s-1]
MTSFPSLEAVFSTVAIPPYFLPWLLESIAAVALAVSQLPPLVWWLLLAALVALLLAFLYNWFDLHVVSHLFVGDRVKVVHHAGSNVARAVFARMRIPHFWPTPWLCSPHLQTTFVHFLAPTPDVPYIRHVVRTPDGGTLGLDWAEPAAAAPADGGEKGGQGKGAGAAGMEGSGEAQVAGGRAERTSQVPIVIVVPGLTSQSSDKVRGGVVWCGVGWDRLWGGRWWGEGWPSEGCRGGGKGGEAKVARGRAERTSQVPIFVVVPGLTSQSSDKYMRQCVAGVTRHGWRALVPNHRGLGGVTITSNRFYNAGWTTDLRFVISLVQQDYPHAPLYAIGTSLGANILVKYLGEEGASGPIQAAVSIGNPWDLLICDRWMNRRTRQRVYNTAMVTGLRDFAKLHKDSFQHLVDVQHVMKARTIRQFDDRITRIVSNYETVDTYYRRCGSAQFLPEVAVPLLAVSALDDPICTREAIPWDEAKANPNVVLAVSHHGGHLAYLQGLTASSIWWVSFWCAWRAVHVGDGSVWSGVGSVTPRGSSSVPAGPPCQQHMVGGVLVCMVCMWGRWVQLSIDFPQTVVDARKASGDMGLTHIRPSPLLPPLFAFPPLVALISLPPRWVQVSIDVLQAVEDTCMTGDDMEFTHARAPSLLPRVVAIPPPVTLLPLALHSPLHSPPDPSPPPRPHTSSNRLKTIPPYQNPCCFLLLILSDLCPLPATLVLPPQAPPVPSTTTNPPPHPHPHFMEPTPFLTSTPSFRSVAALGTLPPPPSSSSPLSPSQTSLGRRRTPSSLGNISEEEAREGRLGAPSLTGRGGKRGGPIGVFSIEGEEAEERGKVESGESVCVEGTGRAAGGERGGGGGREAERGEGRGKVQWVGSSGGGLVGKDERGRGEVGEGEGEREEEEEEEDEEEGMCTVSMSVLAGTIDGRESVIDEDEGKEGEVGSAVGEGGGEDEWEMGPAGAMCGEDDLGEVVSGTGKTGSTILRFESEEQLRVAAVVVRELMSKIQRCLESSPPALQSPLSARRSTVPMRQHKSEDADPATATHQHTSNQEHPTHLPHHQLHLPHHPPASPSHAPSTDLFAAAASPGWAGAASPRWHLAYLALAVACPLVASAVALRLYRRRAAAGGSGSLGLARLASALAKP